MTKQTYGSCNETSSGKFQVIFYNPQTKQKINIGSFDKEEAIEKLNEANFDFFSNNTHLLPKSISINREHRRYDFKIRISDKSKYITSDKNLDEIVAIRDEFALNILR